MGRTVVDSRVAIDADIGNRRRGDDDVGTAGPVIVIGAADLHVGRVGADIRVGRKFGGIGHAVFGVKNRIAFLSADRNGVAVAVVDLFNTGDRHIGDVGRSDDDVGAAGPVVVVGAGNLDVGRVGADIRVGRKFGGIGHAVFGVKDRIAFLSADRNGVAVAVVDLFNAADRHVGDRRRGDRSGNCVCGRSDVVGENGGVPLKGVGHGDGVIADIGGFKRARSGHGDFVGRGNAADFAERDHRIGLPVVDLAGDRGAGDRYRGLFDDRSHRVGRPVAETVVALDEEVVGAGILVGVGISPGFTVFGIERRGDGPFEDDQVRNLAAVDNGRPLGAADLFDRAQVDDPAVDALVPDSVELGVVIGVDSGVQRLAVAGERISVCGKENAAVIFHEVGSELHGRQVGVAADGDRLIDVQQVVPHDDAVRETEHGAVLAADRTQSVVREGDVDAGIGAARGGDPLVVAGNHDVGEGQFAVAVADRPVRSGVSDENGIGDIGRAARRQIEGGAVGTGGVFGEDRIRNRNFGVLGGVDAAGVGFRAVLGEDRVGDGQDGTGRGIDGPAHLPGVGTGNVNLIEGQIAGVIDRAPVLGGVAVGQRKPG